MFSEIHTENVISSPSFQRVTSGEDQDTPKRYVISLVLMSNKLSAQGFSQSFDTLPSILGGLSMLKHRVRSDTLTSHLTEGALEMSHDLSVGIETAIRHTWKHTILRSVSYGKVLPRLKWTLSNTFSRRRNVALSVACLNQRNKQCRQCRGFQRSSRLAHKFSVQQRVDSEFALVLVRHFHSWCKRNKFTSPNTGGGSHPGQATPVLLDNFFRRC